MQAIDLTHTISSDMPVFPGDPSTRLQCESSCEADGFSTTYICMCSHAGTHIDPPAHVYASGKTLDAFPASQFLGGALVVDCCDLPANAEIPTSLVRKHETQISQADFLLFRTGHDFKWGLDEYFCDYPALSVEAARFIAGCDLKGIGFDTPSPDKADSEDLLVHKALLANNNMIILENLTNMDALPTGLFQLVALPLLWKDSDGAPARIVAMVED